MQHALRMQQLGGVVNRSKDFENILRTRVAVEVRQGAPGCCTSGTLRVKATAALMSSAWGAQRARTSACPSPRAVASRRIATMQAGLHVAGPRVSASKPLAASFAVGSCASGKRLKSHDQIHS